MRKKYNKNVVLLAYIVLFLCLGVFNSWNVFHPYLMQKYNWTSAYASISFYTIHITFVIWRISDRACE